MNKYQKEIELTKLSHEQKAFQELKKTYTQALADTKAMVKKLQEDVSILESSNLGDKSILQSRIYQLNYQKAMEEQLTSICNVVNSKNVTNIQTFLTKMYQDSYLGVNYNLQKSGIPVLMAVNPSLIVKSINTPTNKLKFSETLYKRTEELKKAYKEEISRGIATGKGYKEIAKQLDQKTKIGFNNAYRIARTEGGRVSSEASMTAMRDAKAKGADIVKQWLATLDMRTRDVHGRLDGQIREIDENFEIDGYEAQAPHGFGYPEMDINCRCAVLSVPRWDIEGFDIRYDDANRGLIETQNYQDWKNKYYIKLEENNKVKEIMEQAESRIASYKLTKEEKSAIITYTSSEAYMINDLLRRDIELTGMMARLSSNLSKALEKMPSYKGVVNRSLFFDDEQIKQEFIDSLKEKEITFKSFISASKEVYDDTDDIRLIIRSKNGKDLTSFNENEAEVLFDKNSKFKLIKSYEKDGKLYFELKEI